MSDRLDITRRGSREYSPKQADIICKLFVDHHSGSHHAVTVAVFTHEVHAALRDHGFAPARFLDGRTVRQVLTDRDGKDFILGTAGEAGYFVCTWADDAELHTRRLERSVRTLVRRIEERRRYATHLPLRQGTLL